MLLLRIAIAVGVLGVAGCGSRSGLRAPDVGARDASDDRVVLADRAAIDATDATPSVDVPETDNPVVTALNGLRWELPCVQVVETVVCTAPDSRGVSADLRGTAGERYRATLRFRGVVEEKEYIGGTPRGVHFQVGGTPVMDPWNVYQLEVSSPRQAYYLNRGTTGLYSCTAIDEIEEIEIDVGATVRLLAQAVDARQIRNVDRNGRPIVIDGVAPAPAPFDGQFIQMDVIGVVRLR
jgi:hypothetical protein